MSGLRGALRWVTVGMVSAGLLLGAGVGGASAAKSGGTTTTTPGSCSRRNPCSPAPDTTAPAVAITSPAGGATVRGTIYVSGSSSDNVSVTKVEVRIDGGAYQAATGTTSWSRPIDTTTLADGAHTLTARATDSTGNVATASSSITVANGTADATPPTVDIAAPTAGATVTGSITVTGRSYDASGVTRVDVAVDGGTFAPAQGTGTWSAAVDTTSYGDGPHTVSARATDANGLVQTTSTSVTFANGRAAGDTVVTDPAAVNKLTAVGRSRLAQWGDVTGLLANEEVSNRKVAFFRNATTGATSTAELPQDSRYGWSNATTVMTASDELWVFGGTGPLLARQYRLAGTPLPTSASLVSTTSFGDADSRVGDMIRLRSGALVVSWHQQGTNGVEGMRFAHLSAGKWSQLALPAFTPTAAARQALVQQPADGSVWAFVAPDAWGAIGAAHLTETATGLRVDWTDGQYFSVPRHGSFGPDPENPDVAAAADPDTGEIALAYQSTDRQRFTTASGSATGSRVAIARITAAGSIRFDVAPVWAERVSALGLVVAGGSTYLSHRPVDPTTLRFDEVQVIRGRSGTWDRPTSFGTIEGTDRVTYAVGRPEFSTGLSDGKVHLRTF